MFCFIAEANINECHQEEEEDDEHAICQRQIYYDVYIAFNLCHNMDKTRSNELSKFVNNTFTWLTSPFQCSVYDVCVSGTQLLPYNH